MREAASSSAAQKNGAAASASRVLPVARRTSTRNSRRGQSRVPAPCCIPAAAASEPSAAYRHSGAWCREPNSSCPRTTALRRNNASRKPRRSGRGLSTHAGERIAHSSGTKAEPRKDRPPGGSGPASGNGNSSRPAESAAAAHNFQDSNFQNEGCIQATSLSHWRAAAEPKVAAHLLSEIQTCLRGSRCSD